MNKFEHPFCVPGAYGYNETNMMLCLSSQKSMDINNERCDNNLKSFQGQIHYK